MEAIRNGLVYVKEVNGHLPGLYYLVEWKSYLKEKNTGEPFLAVIYLQKMVITFYKDHLEKSTVISALLDPTPPMSKSTI